MGGYPLQILLPGKLVMLKDLLVSRVRVKLLEVFLSDPSQMYHVRDLVRRVGEEINAVRRELSHLEQVGLLKKENRGNRLYYWTRQDYPLYGDLISIVSKTSGFGLQLIKNRGKLGKLSFVVFSGRFAQRLPRADPGEVDILVVGEVMLSELSNVIRVEEAKREMEINYTVMSDEEFKFRKVRRDPFLQKILLGSRVMIIGNQEDLVS